MPKDTEYVIKTDQGDIIGADAENLRDHFNEARDALVFMLESSREQSRRVTLLGSIIKICHEDYDYDCSIEFTTDIAKRIKRTYNTMIDRTRELRVEDFVLDDTSFEDPYRDLLFFWDEKHGGYHDVSMIISDSFVYDTVYPMGSRISQLWSAVHEEMDHIFNPTAEEEVHQDNG